MGGNNMKYSLIIVSLAAVMLLSGCLDNSDENLPPAARDSMFTMTVDTTLNETLTAYDGNDDALSYQLEQGTDIGELTVNSDGTFSYTPPSEYVGDVDFRYSVTDGELSDEGTVSIAVEAEQVAASFYVREAYGQPANAEPLPLNGRIINDDVSDTAAFADLVAEGGNE
jgi:ABC-type Fe3+-hydroxamate transport system substrate-binding protein|tara:strand:+ start:4948 stop:5454 length:507 start_codon:yes stop_codon:yes gene_type:complete